MAEVAPCHSTQDVALAGKMPGSITAFIAALRDIYRRIDTGRSLLHAGDAAMTPFRRLLREMKSDTVQAINSLAET